MSVTRISSRVRAIEASWPSALVMLLPVSKRGLVILTNSDRGPMVYERLILDHFGEVGTELMKRARGEG